MTTIIETERLLLRRFTLDDAPFFMSLVNDAEWIKNIGNRNVHTLEEARAYLTKSYLANYERIGFGFYLTSLKDGTPVGMCGLIMRDGLDDVDIGFAFMPAWRGQGYAVEAARASLVYGRDVLKKSRVVAIVLPTNTASVAVLKKIGCQFEKMIQLPHNPEPLALYVVAM